MANSYYTPSGQPTSASRGRSINVREEFALVEDGFDAVETAMNLKAPKASPTFTGTVVLPADTTIGNVSPAELSYVDGVTSAIQTQLNAKVTGTSGTNSPNLDAAGCSFYQPSLGVGTYVKNGGQLTYSGSFYIDLSGSTIAGTDTVELNLPVASKTGIGQVMGVGVFIFSVSPGLVGGSYGPFALRVFGSSSVAELGYINSMGLFTQLTADKIGAAGVLSCQFSVSYLAN